MLVTGCMRSGTRSFARMFDLSHELDFNEFTIQPPNYKVNECSWYAQPFATNSVFQNLLPIIFLVRNPISIAASINDTSLNFWNTKTAAKDFIETHLPQIKEFETSIDKTFYYIIHWMRPLMKYPMIHIEDIRNSLILNQRKLQTVLTGHSKSLLLSDFKSLVKELGYK